MATVDLRSVSVRGVFNYARARLIWRNGLLRVFTKDGPMLDIRSQQPQRVAGYLGAWEADTASGSIRISSKCMTCGGPAWWRVLRMNTEELWSMKWNASDE